MLPWAIDLDIIVRCSPNELFRVGAPAATYHGRWNRGLRRSRLHQRRRNASGRIAHGSRTQMVHRGNSKRGRQARGVGSILLARAVLLVQRLPNWRHIDVRWNMVELCGTTFVLCGHSSGAHVRGGQQNAPGLATTGSLRGRAARRSGYIPLQRKMAHAIGTAAKALTGSATSLSHCRA